MSVYVNDEVVARVVAWIGEREIGVKAAAVGDFLGVGQKRASNILCHGRAAGVLFWVRAKKGCMADGLWAAAANLRATEDAVQALLVEQKAQAAIKHRQRVREYHQRIKDGDNVPDMPTVRRIVDAATAPRINTRAPASVWQLGAMA